MYQIGVGGAFINVIQSIYASNILHVKVGNNNIRNAIDSSIEVKQGDNLSPNFFFTFFLNDVVDIFDKDMILFSLDQHPLTVYFMLMMLFYYHSLLKDYITV